MITTHPTGARKGADFLVHVDPAQLKAQGVNLVGVYLKNTTKAQVAAYHKHGISVFLIHQRGYEGKGPTPAASGAKHGIEAATQAQALGAPKGLPIVFASMGDYDNNSTTLPGSVAYYQAAKRACEAGGYKAGAYGDWDLLKALGPTALSCQAAAKGWSFDWVIRKWRGPHVTAHLLQYPSKAVATPSALWAGVRVDPLDVLKPCSVWGPPAKVVPPVKVAVPILKRQLIPRYDKQVVILQSQLRFLKLYTSSVDGKFGPVTQASVKRLQQMLKRSITGVYDQPTAVALSKFLTDLRSLAPK